MSEKKPETTQQSNGGIPKGAKFELEVDGKKAYLSKIDRGTLELVLGLIAPVHGAPQYLRAGEIIMQKCWLSGDEELRKNEDYFASAAMQACSAVDIGAGSLKKL